MFVEKSLNLNHSKRYFVAKRAKQNKKAFLRCLELNPLSDLADDFIHPQIRSAHYRPFWLALEFVSETKSCFIKRLGLNLHISYVYISDD